MLAMTKILVIGDVHGHLDRMVELIQSDSFDFALQVGDFGAYLPTSNLSAIPEHRRHDLGQFASYYDAQKSIPVPTYFCKGNHEDFELLNRHIENPVLPNLFYVPNGQVLKIQGVCIGFLGGNFSTRWFDKPIPKNCQSQKILGYLRDYEIQAIKAHQSPIDILVTHEPSMAPEFTGDRKYGCEAVHEMIAAVQPKYAFSGHIHKYAQGTLGQTKCVALGAVNYNAPSTYILEI